MTQQLPGAPHKKRSIELDVLRGTAIILVLFHHYAVTCKQAGFLKIPATFLERLGWTGVDLFFVLSGFLVGGLLFNELRTKGKLDIKRFIIRRGIRIWPAYYAYLFALFLLLLVHPSSDNFKHLPLWKAFLPNLVHLQNYNIYFDPAWSGPYVGFHTWSLAIEEHFYLALPVILLLIAKFRPNKISLVPWIGLAVGVVCLGLRWNLQFHVHPWPTFYIPTHLRVDSMFMGVILAYWYHFRPDFFARLGKIRGPLLAVGLALILPMGKLPLDEKNFVWTFGYTFLYLGYALILIACVSTPPGVGVVGRFFQSSPARLIAKIGTFSYSIYLWAGTIITVPIRMMVDHGLLGGALRHFAMDDTDRYQFYPVHPGRYVDGETH